LKRKVNREKGWGGAAVSFCSGGGGAMEVVVEFRRDCCHV